MGDLIAAVRRHLESQDRVEFRMGGMGTSLEGDIDDIFALCAELHKIPLREGVPRAYTVIKIDQRTDKEQSLDDKVESVEAKVAGG